MLAAAKTVEFMQRGYGHYKLKIWDGHVVIGEIPFPADPMECCMIAGLILAAVFLAFLWRLGGIVLEW